MSTEYAGSGNLHRSMELLWDLRERPTRGPKPGLTLSKIVKAAIKIADVDGLEALSMRRVATELGVGTMSLYRYVPGKAELLDLMLDEIAALPSDPPDISHGWRNYLETIARGHWRLCLDHPWYPFVDQARPILGPNGLAGVEHMFTQLKTIGLGDQEMVKVITALFAFVEGVARIHISESEAEARTGISNEEFWAAQEPALTAAMETGDYPTMAQVSEDTFWFGHDEVFEFGLERFLDGLEPYMQSRRARPDPDTANGAEG